MVVDSLTRALYFCIYPGFAAVSNCSYSAKQNNKLDSETSITQGITAYAGHFQLSLQVLLK